MSLHPSLAVVRLAVRRELEDLPPGGTVVVACSGGADSLALLSATIHEGHQREHHIIGATVDHGLQDGSAEHALAVVAQMATLGVDETVSATVHVEADGHGQEDAARHARYAVLGEIAARFDAAAVLLGHTRDDQAETVLMGLARGSGGRSLAGMRRRFGADLVYRRPLLDVPRDDTQTACQVEGIIWWNDPHNVDPAYTRVRVRRTVLPVLEEHLGPGVAAALARTGELVRPDMEFLDALAEQTYDDLRDDAPGLDVGAVHRLPPAIRGRVLRLAALDAGAHDAELFHTHVQALARLVSPRTGGPSPEQAQLPGHVSAMRRGNRLTFEKTPVED